MSGVQGVSTERLSSLLGHVTHRGFDDLVDPKNQGIAYPTGNPDLFITGDPLFYTSLLATLDIDYPGRVLHMQYHSTLQYPIFCCCAK
jgi:hypothetical protein